MKSVKQRRIEIKTERAKRRALAQQDAATEFQSKLFIATQAHEANRAKLRLSVGKQIWVNLDNLRPTNSHGTPDFVTQGYYADKAFVFKPDKFTWMVWLGKNRSNEQCRNPLPQVCMTHPANSIILSPRGRLL